MAATNVPGEAVEPSDNNKERDGTATEVQKPAKKAVVTGKPLWLADQLKPKPVTRTCDGGLEPIRVRTNLRGESLPSRAVLAYNYLPRVLKEMPMGTLKREAKIWVMENVPAKPP